MSVRKSIELRLRQWSPALIAAAIISHASVAAAVQVRVCIAVENDATLLWDYSPTMDGRDALEDFGRLDQPEALRVPRILTRIRSNVGATIWGWAPVGDDGCTPELDIDAGAPLEVENYWWSYFSDSDVSVVSLTCSDDDSDCTTGSEINNAIVPAEGGIVEIELGATRRSYVHFAASFAEFRTHTSFPVGTEYYTRTGIPLKTVSNRFAGGKPTSNFGGSAFRAKFTVTHEYGHLKTLVEQIPAFSDADVDYCHGEGPCTATHSFASPEWQAAAAIEGFANFYSMSIWNDIDANPRDATLLSAVSDSVWNCRYQPDPNVPSITLPDDCIDPNSSLMIIADSWHHQANCQPDACPAGVATESDWTFALWDMRLYTSAQFPVLIALLSMAYPWSANGTNQLFWNNFVNAANIQLTQAQLTTWLGVAEVRGIDR